MRIVFVDDSKDLVEVMRVLVQQLLRCEVRTARSGLEALSVIREFAPHIAFIDLVMPGMCGLEVARTLKLEPSPPKLVAFSGLNTEEAALRAGFDSFLLKPASMRLIIDECQLN
jgi:CheY-like chemotaxis protein